MSLIQMATKVRAIALAAHEHAALVSGDGHLLELAAELPIYAPADFLSVLDRYADENPSAPSMSIDLNLLETRTFGSGAVWLRYSPARSMPRGAPA